jgi:hypothetical protein
VQCAIIKQRWIAKICYDSKTRYLGAFDTKQEAALAYDRKAMQCTKVKPLNYENIAVWEKTHGCSLCSKKFSSAQHRDSHVLSMHEGISCAEQKKEAKRKRDQK